MQCPQCTGCQCTQAPARPPADREYIDIDAEVCSENNWEGVENPNEFGILAGKNVKNGHRVPTELWLPVFQLFPVPPFANVP